LSNQLIDFPTGQLTALRKDTTEIATQFSCLFQETKIVNIETLLDGPKTQGNFNQQQRNTLSCSLTQYCKTL